MSHTAPPPGSTIPLPVIPKCPHCDKRMVNVDGYQYMLGAFLVLTVHCHNCEVLLHMQIIPVGAAASEEEPPAEGKSKLWQPS